MSHYDAQREADVIKQKKEEEQRLKKLSSADYEEYIAGVRQDVDDTSHFYDGAFATSKELVEMYGELHDYVDDPNDIYNYLEPEFLDFLQVLRMGALKHGDANWLEPAGKKSSHKDMHASMFRHLALSYANQRLDQESGLDHLLHLASRALMLYTRIKRGLIHPED